jgi:hypothetical protein
MTKKLLKLGDAHAAIDPHRCPGAGDHLDADVALTGRGFA